MQGFGRVGGTGTGISGSGTGQRGIDQSLGSHVPQGQNVGSASGQVHSTHCFMGFVDQLLSITDQQQAQRETIKLNQAGSISRRSCKLLQP